MWEPESTPWGGAGRIITRPHSLSTLQIPVGAPLCQLEPSRLMQSTLVNLLGQMPGGKRWRVKLEKHPEDVWHAPLPCLLGESPVVVMHIKWIIP